MIKFFRHIRRSLIQENKMGKYLKYAIGEIILVVIGILIALQVNNWNEERKLKKESIIILENLKSDLKEDLFRLNQVNKRIRDREEKSKFLYNLIINSKQEKQVDSQNVIRALIRAGFISKFIPSLAAYNEIQSTGKLSLVKSQKIKNALASYKSQANENHMILGPYDQTQKQFEGASISQLSGIPIIDALGSDFPNKNKNLKFNLDEMARDKKFMSLLKHICYHSSIEYGLNEGVLKPKIVRLLFLIDGELNND